MILKFKLLFKSFIFLKSKVLFNLSLVVENQYLNGEYKKAKKILKNFKKDDKFYYWYRVKKKLKLLNIR